MAHLIQSSAIIALISSDGCYFEFQNTFSVGLSFFGKAGGPDCRNQRPNQLPIQDEA